MGGLGVIIEYSAFSQGKGSAKDKLSCSGLYLGSGWILTHGTIAIDLLKEKVAQPLLDELKTKGSVMNMRGSPMQTILDNTQSEFKVIFSESILKSLHSSEVPQALSSAFASTTSSALDLQDQSRPNKVQDKSLHVPLASSSFETSSYFCHCASISMLFVQAGIMKSMESMMPASEGWRLTEDKEGHSSSIDLETIILSSFALLKVVTGKSRVDDDVSDVIPLGELTHLVEKYLTVTTGVDKGSSVYIESSPFGSLSPSVFLNSLSKGIISNICGSERDVYLTDARCVMGSEGAPVYTTVDEKVYLCGLVISPFCWRHGEWLGLSLLAAARPILLSLKSYVMAKRIEGVAFKIHEDVNRIPTVEPMKRRLDYDMSLKGIGSTLDNIVVGISCGGGWGSGIVISSSPGLILTCAHVIQPSKFGEVVIITANGTRIPGHVIYHSYPSCFVQQNMEDNENQCSSIWDLAIVWTPTFLPEPLPLATQLPPEGSTVVVAGHGIFSPNTFPEPSLSHGIISKIVSVEASSLSYPDILKNKLCTSGLSKKNVCIKDKPVPDDNIQFRGQVKSYCGKSSVSPSLVKSNAREELDPDQKEIEGVINGAMPLGDNGNGLVPVMFQTTCSVYAGNSGGPVVFYHPQNGLQVAGVMVCNTRDLANKATFPHINLAVPVPAIKKIISAYISSGDKMVLNYLGVECPKVSQLWALGLTPRSQL